MLFKQGFIQPDEKIIKDIMETKDKNNFPYHYYLYSGLKSFIDENKAKMIESKIKQKYEEEIIKFEEKCQIGENDSYICSLIRQDSVEEFISYVNRTNTPLSIQIQPSIFETNLFLMQKRPTLIEYATFFGSIQIIQYLKYNKVSLNDSLWLYAIHSDNAELIHFLEENEIKLQRNMLAYDEIFKESIVCHHNAIADYIKDNFIDTTQLIGFSFCIINNCNYYYYPTDIENIISKSDNEFRFDISQICFSLTQITIPSSVTSIGNYAFNECSTLTQIKIPSSVTSIGYYAFCGCSSLTQISIPSSVTSIEDYAFCGCSSLTQISIPSSVTSIEYSAFKGCSSLTQITISSSVTSFGSDLFIGIKKLEIKGDIKYIPNNFFSGCSSLTQITIPSSVTSIGNSAFSGCSSLTQITIPSSVTSIGNFAFRECSSLAQIVIPSATALIKCTFKKCEKLDKIVIVPFNYKIIDYIENAFLISKEKANIEFFDRLIWMNQNITSAIIPSFIKTIGCYSFNECKSLTQITIPPSVTTIEEYAFSYCSSLKQIIIPSSVTSIGNHAFLRCSSLTQITFETPSSLTSIESFVFHGCSSLINLTIPSSVRLIKKCAFNECSSLKQIEFPLYLFSIGKYAFNHCSSLEEITLPFFVISIGKRIFNNCFSLTSISIPHQITIEKHQLPPYAKVIKY